MIRIYKSNGEPLTEKDYLIQDDNITITINDATGIVIDGHLKDKTLNIKSNGKVCLNGKFSCHHQSIFDPTPIRFQSQITNFVCLPLNLFHYLNGC
jgi:hypothetical protein